MSRLRHHQSPHRALQILARPGCAIGSFLSARHLRGPP